MDHLPYPPSPFFIPSFSNPHLTMPHFYFPFFFKGNLIQRVYHAQSQIHWFCRTLLFPSGSQVKCNKNKFTLALKKFISVRKENDLRGVGIWGWNMVITVSMSFLGQPALLTGPFSWLFIELLVLLRKTILSFLFLLSILSFKHYWGFCIFGLVSPVNSRHSVNNLRVFQSEASWCAAFIERTSLLFANISLLKDLYKPVLKEAVAGNK